ncbi:CYTH domain-containing protein [Oceanobacillus halotolerans]|uniref:CYTH domain-containing protein n=1 Tax=Oceanobacillus halotolerans TaxID=2663380 RepID=UPI0013DD1EE9|nr:CYTH domain-containing protein [Oceanobacillus halotolerans]
MTQEIEIEYKNLLSKGEFQLIKTHFSFPQQGTSQTNYYFETKDFALKKHGCALRIRKKGDLYTLTLKEPHAEGLLETHDIISEDIATKWLHGMIIPQPNTSKQLASKDITGDDLVYFGNLTTTRRELSYQDALLVLDYNTYHDKTDYELEVEAPSSKIGERVFQSILDQFSIPKRSTPNKIERFFAARPN